jgi:hypothetical protein
MTDTFDDFSLLLPHMRESLTVSLVFSACDCRIAKKRAILSFRVCPRSEQTNYPGLCALKA